VDAMNGTWQMEVDLATVPASITVVSLGGGSVVATQSTQPAAPRIYTLQYPSDKGGEDEKIMFRPRISNESVKGEKAKH